MPYTALTAHVVGSAELGFERKVWTLEPASASPKAVLVFLDAEFYVERSAAPAVVNRLRALKVIPDVAAVFVSHNGQVSRQEDFTCSPRYAKFVAHDLVKWIGERWPAVEDRLLIGLSLSGLASAYIASRYPDRFRSAIAQSGSFWWERGRFADELPDAARPGQEFWLSVGSLETEVNVTHLKLFQELSQITVCTSASAALRAKGYSVSYREYDGGHDFDCWRDDLSLALAWMWRRSHSI